jgi:hypothetical protein
VSLRTLDVCGSLSIMNRSATTPTLDGYVQAFLLAMRAPLKERTQFGPAGRTVIRSNGERVLYGPKGQPIRVIEDPLHGTQIEHGEHLHAVVRPSPVTTRTRSNS